jgi:hypothetical protein
LQLRQAAAVAVLLDEAAGLGEGGGVLEQAGAVERDVGQVQGHGAAAGDAVGLAQVRVGGGGVALGVAELGAGEEAAGENVLAAGGAQAVEGALGVVDRLGAGRAALEAVLEQGGAGEGEVVEGDVEHARLVRSSDLQRLPRPPRHLGTGRQRLPGGLGGGRVTGRGRPGPGGPLGPGQQQVAVRKPRSE